MPTEIKEKILKMLEYHSPKLMQYNWPLVNKHWYGIYQSQAYQVITVDLRDPRRELQARQIMDSVYQPGQWVKDLTIYSSNGSNGGLERLSLEGGVRLLLELKRKTHNVQRLEVLADKR